MAKKKSANVDLNQLLGEIQKRAYEIYEEKKRNNIPSNDLEDWLDAEREIKQKYGIK